MRTLFLLLFVSILYAETTPRLGLDPILRGVWKMHATSLDSGKTVNSINPPTEFAAAKATSITFADGDVVKIDNVVIYEEEGQAPKNIATLANGNMMCFSKQGNFILIQVFNHDGEKVVEKSRFLITVE